LVFVLPLLSFDKLLDHIKYSIVFLVL
jgi:hypothetical protein